MIDGMTGTDHLCSFYEGHAIHDIGFPIRVLKLLGVDTLIGRDIVEMLQNAY